MGGQANYTNMATSLPGRVAQVAGHEPCAAEAQARGSHRDARGWAPWALQLAKGLVQDKCNLTHFVSR